MGQELTRGSHKPCIHQGRRQARFDQRIDLFFFWIGQHVRLQTDNGKQRAGFRHPIGGIDLNSHVHRRQGQSFRQGGAADDDLPLGQIEFLGDRAAHEHLNNRRHAVGQGHLFRQDQPQQHLRFITAGIDLFDPQHGRRIRNAPGMDMEHGGQGHIDVRGPEAAGGIIRARHQQQRLCVQDQLSMGKKDALGKSRGPGGVEGGGPSVFIKIGEIIRIGGPGEKFFVFPVKSNLRRRLVPVIGDQNNLLDRCQLIPDGF